MTHGEKKSDGNDRLASPSRRKVLIAGAVAGAALMASGTRAFAAAEDAEIRVGFIHPMSGALALFGQCDPYILSLVRRALTNGLTIRGHHYRVSILDRDSQSSPSRATQLANELVTKNNVQLMLSTSTAGTVNPVSDVCEASRVPSLATNDPLEAFFFGRGGKPGHPSPFHWSFDFSFAMQQFANCYLSMWDKLKTNRKVAILYSDSAAGKAFRNGIEPFMRKHGYTIVDPGLYQEGTTSYASQIALFKREKCQIFSTMSNDQDFFTMWRQAAEQHYNDEVIIAQVAKTGLFPQQITPLGPLGYNLAGATYWSPKYPYSSPVTGMTSAKLASGYEKATGRQWTQQVGASMAVFDMGIEALKAATNPTDRTSIRDAITNSTFATTQGPVNFKTGPYPNTSNADIIGGQWIMTPKGSRYPIEFVTVGNVNNPKVPIQAKLKPYNA
ncbi:MAG: ABC transporter substrate-binding protein [Rhodanobacteraceae bacterium]